MERNELSGAVSTLCQTPSAGSEAPKGWRSPNSERQSSTFIVTKKAVTSRNGRRARIRGSGTWNINGLTGTQALRFDARVGRENRLDWKAVSACDRSKCFALFHG